MAGVESHSANIQNIFEELLYKANSFYFHLAAQFTIFFYFTCFSSNEIFFAFISMGHRIFTFVLLHNIPAFSEYTVAPWVTIGLYVASKITREKAILSIAFHCLQAIIGVGLVEIFLPMEVETYNYLYPPGWVVVLTHSVAAFAITCKLLSSNDVRPTSPMELLVMSFMALPPSIDKKDLNPAVSLAAAIFHNDHQAWNYAGIQWVGTFSGATAAAIYHVHLAD